MLSRSRVTRLLMLFALTALICVPGPSAFAAGEPSPADTEFVDDGSWITEPEDDAWKPGQDKDIPKPDTSMDITVGNALRGVRYRALIVKHARQNHLAPALVAAVIHQESGFNRKARSPVGARGLMQLMPATARWLGGSMTKIYQPEHNIRLGTKFLAYVRTVVGRNERLMAAAYNAGPGAVTKFQGVPPYAETQNYVRRVAQLRRMYASRY